MANIELAIKIDEGTYNNFVRNEYSRVDVIALHTALTNGTPLKTGHWIGDNQAFYIYAKCSECESVHDIATNYCPDCGCLMDRTEFDEYVKTEGE